MFDSIKIFSPNKFSATAKISVQKTENLRYNVCFKTAITYWLVYLNKNLSLNVASIELAQF